MRDDFWKKWIEMLDRLNVGRKKLPDTQSTPKSWSVNEIEIAFVTDSEKPVSIDFPDYIKKIKLSTVAANLLIDKLQKAVRAAEAMKSEVH